MSRSNWFSSRRSPVSRRPSGRRKSPRLSRRRKAQRLEFETLEERRVLAATVTTDFLDYAPGSTAQVFASDFAIGETVEFQVLHSDGVPNTGAGHEPWQVTDGVSGDFNGDGILDGDLDGIADGNIHTTWYVNPDDSADSTFELTANGLSSGLSASHAFTDSVSVVGGSTTNSSSSSRTSATFAHTVAAGADRLLLVTVLTNGDEGVTSVTYGGQGMSLGLGADSGDSGGTAVRIYYLVAPPVGTANVVVSFASSVDPSFIRAENLTGVHQTNPLDNANGDFETSGSSIFVNITTTSPNSLIYGAIAAHGGDTDPFDSGSGVTQLWDTDTGSSPVNEIGVWGGFRTTTSAGTYSFGATADESDDWTIGAVALRMSPETPNASWTTTLPVNTANDHNTTTAYNPSGSAGAETPPSQSYQADLYENWDSNVQNAAQTDIVTYQTAADDHFYYFRFNQRGSVSGNESTVFHLEIDADYDNVGGDARGDYFVQFNPQNNDVSASWRNAGLISDELFRDGNNNAGGSNLAAPDSGDPDGYSTSVSYGNNDVFGRIVGGAVEIAVRRSAINETSLSDIRSRGWTKQDGNIDKSKLMFHDHNTASDLSSNRIDNTHGANTTTWLPTGGVAQINIEKLVNNQDADSPSGPILAVGGMATFTYVVTNTGTVPLSNVTVVDDNGTPGLPGDNFSPTFTGGDTNSNGLLDLNETWTYVATRTVTAGQYTNVGTASGKSPTNQDVSDTDPANHFGAAPLLNIEKLVNGNDADAATGPILPGGGTATFIYNVTNTGNIAVGSIAVIDDNGTPGNAADDFTPIFTGGDANSNGLLDLGETWSYSANRPIIAGQYTNIGRATAQVAATGQSVSDTDPANYFGAEPAIDIEKLINGQDADSATGPILAAGNIATFTYNVTNIGNIALGNVVVVDDNGTPGNPADDFSPTFTGGDSNNNGLLDLGETWTYSSSHSAAAGQYTNLGTVAAQVAATGQSASDSDPANYFGAAPGIDIEKLVNSQDADSPTGPVLAAGSTATFTYIVTNTGNIALGSVVVVDDNGTPGNPGDDFSPTFTSGDTNSNGLLDLDETWIYNASGIVTAGQYTNIGSASGQVAATQQSASDTDPANYFGAAPSIDIEKLVNGQDADASTGPILAVGSIATFTYNVTNTGNISLGSVVVVDDNGTPGNTADDFNPTFTGGDANNNGLLDLGETWTYNAIRTVTPGQYTNVGSVAGQVVATGQTASDTDPANLYGAAPALDIEKLVNGQDADTATGPVVPAGSMVTFTYLVTNTGNIGLANVVVVDDNGTPGSTADDFNPTFTGGDTNGNGLLDLGETWSYTTMAIAVVGQYTNLGAATGSVTATGQTATDSDAANYFGKRDPIIVVGPDKGNTSHPIVKVINKDTGKIISQFYAYEGKFLGGVQLAVGDLTGDGIDEIIVAPGQGRVGEVRVFTQHGVELTQFRTQPYGSTCTGGIEVAVGDVNGDGKNDIVTSTKYGRTDVRVFYNSYDSGNPYADPIANSANRQFYVFASNFKGGGDVIVADMGTFYNGIIYDANTPDGKSEIIVGNGPGMRSTILVYDVTAAPKVVDTILPFSNTFKGGITLSAARVNGDAIPDLIVAAGNAGGGGIEIWSGLTNDYYDLKLAAFSAFGNTSTKNMPVHATALDTNGDGIADLLAVVQGTNGMSNQIRYHAMNGALEGIHHGFYGPWNIASLTNADPSLPVNSLSDVAAKDDIYTQLGETTTTTTTAKKAKKARRK